MHRLLLALHNRGILNNILFNNLAFYLGLDKRIKDYLHPYVDFQPEPGKTLQEIAGYSERPEINAVLSSIHEKLEGTRDAIIPDKGQVLDIGCGPGLFLKQFGSNYGLTGIDISQSMCNHAQKTVPEANIHCENFLTFDLPESHYDLIYSVGVLIYFSKSEIKPFFTKVHRLLKPGGALFLSYPHAVSKGDLYYPDLSYVHYSPAYLEKLLKGQFEVHHQQHVTDDRQIGDFDHQPYDNPGGYKNRTYQNSSILIARKL